MGLDPKRAYASLDGIGTVHDGVLDVAVDMGPWSAKVGEYRPAAR
jgi:hypothetical protein